jgi:hypothetical protein
MATLEEQGTWKETFEFLILLLKDEGQISVRIFGVPYEILTEFRRAAP